MSFAAEFVIGDTFQNYSWDYSAGTKNSFSSIGVDIWLFDNSAYSTYKSWLNTSGQADGRVDNSSEEVQLNAATLSTFQSKITDYDSWSIYMQVTHEIFTV